MVVDKYGNLWPTAFDLCPECKQPDNCGDCNHEELWPEHVRELGGVPRGREGNDYTGVLSK